MIASVKGTLAGRGADHVVVEVGGIGLRLFVSRRTMNRLGAEGDSVSMFVHTHVREDAINLYGFADELERTVFEQLISVSGLGPRMALGILSGMDARELAQAICTEDIARLCTVPGIGRKKAEKLVVSLKDKLLEVAGSAESGNGADQVLGDLRSALQNLGFKGTEIEQVLVSLQPRAGGGEQLDELLPEALRLLRG
ncbi:MAG: Holliday junction branch migration protein RuvA [Deltaproteobacteria bacterium]|nr:MAG: Holliday junction branch migration protein RuvA [Deltaproteobacteria bacterium]